MHTRVRIGAPGAAELFQLIVEMKGSEAKLPLELYAQTDAREASTDADHGYVVVELSLASVHHGQWGKAATAAGRGLM